MTHRTTPTIAATFLLSITGVACSGAPDTDGTPQEATEAIIGGTPATSYPESADVQLFQNGQLFAFCSGALIAPKVVLTAGHCVVGITSWQVSLPFANGQTASAKSGATTYVEDPQNPESVNPDAKDIGLVFLDKALSISKFPTLATSPLADGAKVQNLGRIQRGQVTNSFFISRAIRVTDATSQGFPFDYFAIDKIEPGDSGGPDVASGTHKIVAVNSGAGSGSEVLARVDLVHSFIVQQVNAHGGF
jgi:trypsin